MYITIKPYALIKVSSLHTLSVSLQIIKMSSSQDAKKWISVWNSKTNQGSIESQLRWSTLYSAIKVLLSHFFLFDVLHYVVADTRPDNLISSEREWKQGIQKLNHHPKGKSIEFHTREFKILRAKLIPRRGWRYPAGSSQLNSHPKWNWPVRAFLE